jgi:hypothetical protein
VSVRLAWLAHNLIAHPIAGLLWALGLRPAGDWIHDRISPRGEVEP